MPAVVQAFYNKTTTRSTSCSLAAQQLTHFQLMISRASQKLVKFIKQKTLKRYHIYVPNPPISNFLRVY